MNRLSPEQLAYVLQFSHVEKILARLPGVRESYIAGMFGIPLQTYRKIKRDFADRARKAAADLLRGPGFADLVGRLPFTRGQVVVGLGDSITDDYQSWIEILRHLLKMARPKDRIKVINAGISGNTTTEMISRFLDIVLQQPDWILCMAGTNDARRNVFADRQAGMAGIKACRPCRPIGKNTHGERPTKTLVSIVETEKNLAILRHFAATQTTARWVWMTPPTVIERNIASHWFLGPLQLMWRNKDLAAVAQAARRLSGASLKAPRQAPSSMQPCRADWKGVGEPSRRGFGGEVVDIHKIFGNPPNPLWLLPDGLHPSLTGQKAIVTALVERLANAQGNTRPTRRKS